MALLPLGVVGIPTFDGASWPAKLDAFQVCSGNALCLCLRLGIDLELCSKREHSEDDIGDDAAKQVLISRLLLSRKKRMPSGHLILMKLLNQSF